MTVRGTSEILGMVEMFCILVAGVTLMSKLIEPYTLNECSLSYTNYTSIKCEILCMSGTILRTCGTHR